MRRSDSTIFSRITYGSLIFLVPRLITLLSISFSFYLLFLLSLLFFSPLNLILLSFPSPSFSLRFIAISFSLSLSLHFGILFSILAILDFVAHVLSDLEVLTRFVQAKSKANLGEVTTKIKKVFRKLADLVSNAKNQQLNPRCKTVRQSHFHLVTSSSSSSSSLFVDFEKR